MHRTLLAGLLLLALALPASAGRLSPKLEEALLMAGPDDLVPVVVLMEAFPEQGSLLAEVRGMNAEDRRRHVLETMEELAESSQVPVRALLAVSSGEIRDLRVLRGINGVALEATPRIVERLAALPEVRWVLHDKGRPHPGTDQLSPKGPAPPAATPRVRIPPPPSPPRWSPWGLGKSGTRWATREPA